VTAVAAKKTKGASRGRLADGQANPIDVHVGARVRLRRTLLGLTQETLGDALGITFQQVQKYERGANRISSSRLWDLSRVLDVPVAFFFDDISDAAQAASPAQAAGLTTEAVAGFAVAGDGDPLVKRETLELVRTYYRITDDGVRRKVLDLAKALGGAA